MCDDITCEDLHLASMLGMDDITCDNLTSNDKFGCVCEFGIGIDDIICDDIICEDLHLASVTGMDDITCDDLTYDDLNPDMC